MGNVDIKLIGEKADYNYDVKCDVGSISVDGKNESGLENGYNEDNGSDKNIVISSDVGNVTIKFD